MPRKTKRPKGDQAAAEPARRKGASRRAASPEGTLVDQVYISFRERLVTGELEPGSLIVEADLMKKYGVSRTPVREALLRLAREKLVTIAPRHGTFVADLDLGEIGHIHALRRYFEALAACWAAERRRESDIPEIEEAIARLEEEAPAPADLRAMLDSDLQPHRLIYRLAGNPYLAETLSVYYFVAVRAWFLDSRDGKWDPEESQRRMVRVLRAIAEGKAEMAREAAERVVDGWS